ncbi:MAG: hypothetical protein PHU23_10320 [Dehalococcoidales bacterium]|nr:hypothetical protein [Dehalococcoidales bacterium]
MPDSAAPLECLIRQLRFYRPPSISTLVGMLQDNQDYADFVHLVKEFVPERETEILGQPGPEQQIASFAGYFEDRYFPLPHFLRFGDAEEYSDLTQSIPLIALGFGYQDYDDLVQNGNTGAMLMTYFFRQPYGDQGARIALGESCQEHVPAELLQRIPEQGFTPEELHQLLDGTSYQSLATWGDLIHLNTGNDLLDTDEEMLSNSVLPEWSRENVTYFTRQWAEAQEKQQGPFAMADEFEKKPAAYFQELMDFIDQQKERQNDAKLK